MDKLNIMFIFWCKHLGTIILKRGVVKNQLSHDLGHKENIFILMGGQNHGMFPFHKKITCDVSITKLRSGRSLVLGQR